MDEQIAATYQGTRYPHWPWRGVGSGSAPRAGYLWAVTGGGALLKGMAQRIRRETGMPVHIAEEPLDCVAKGTGMALDHFDELKSIMVNAKKYR